MPSRYTACAAIRPVATSCAGCCIFPGSEFPEKWIYISCVGVFLQSVRRPENRTPGRRSCFASSKDNPALPGEIKSLKRGKK